MSPRSQRAIRALIVVAVLALVFQIGHFAEHIAEVYVWLFIDRNTIYMSPIALYIEHIIGGYLVPGASMIRTMNVGKEFLHLGGDLIFLSGIAATYLVTRQRFARIALYVQLFHTVEHVMLAWSIYTLDRQIGMSTLFGLVQPGPALFGYRIFWHFIMNLIPMILIGRALWSVYKERSHAVAHDTVPTVS